MNFEWDEAKNQANYFKHGIDFEAAITIYDDFVYTFQDTRADYGEDRFASIGVVAGIEITVIYTPRGNNKRIISARRSRHAERRKYHEERKKYQNRF